MNFIRRTVARLRAAWSAFCDIGKCDMCEGRFHMWQLGACSGDAWLCERCLDKYMDINSTSTTEEHPDA